MRVEPGSDTSEVVDAATMRRQRRTLAWVIFGLAFQFACIAVLVTAGVVLVALSGLLVGAGWFVVAAILGVHFVGAVRRVRRIRRASS